MCQKGCDKKSRVLYKKSVSPTSHITPNTPNTWVENSLLRISANRFRFENTISLTGCGVEWSDGVDSCKVFCKSPNGGPEIVRNMCGCGAG